MSGGGRVVVVTGANRGIGYELARQLAARGDTVALGARTEDKAREAAAGLEGPGEVLALALDVTRQDHVDAARDELERRYGRVDVLINNAGINYDTDQTAATADLQVVEEALETNLVGAWRVALALLDLLRAAPSPRIVNVSSGAGSLEGMGAGTPAYGVSKAALNALTLKLADDLRGDGMLVNAVCPGWVATDMGGSGGRPVADGAASVLWGADLPDDGPTGGFFRDGRPVAF